MASQNINLHYLSSDILSDTASQGPIPETFGAMSPSAAMLLDPKGFRMQFPNGNALSSTTVSKSPTPSIFPLPTPLSQSKASSEPPGSSTFFSTSLDDSTSSSEKNAHLFEGYSVATTKRSLNSVKPSGTATVPTGNAFDARLLLNPRNHDSSRR